MKTETIFKNIIKQLEAYNIICTPMEGKIKLDFSDTIAFDYEFPEEKTVILEHNNNPEQFHQKLTTLFKLYNEEKMVDNMVKKYEKEMNDKPPYKKIAVWVRFAENQKGTLGCIATDIKEILEEAKQN